MSATDQPRASQTFALPGGTDPVATLTPLWQGRGDPHMRVAGREIVRAVRCPSGPATLRISVSGETVNARAWGTPQAAEEAISAVPGLIGELDEPNALVPRDAVIAGLIHQLPGLRMTRGTPLFETLLIAICGQKITAAEAHRTYGRLIRRHGEPAPGPFPGLFVSPTAEVLGTLPYWAFHPLGLERRRAETVRAVAMEMPRLAALEAQPGARKIERLCRIPGIGPWTAAEAVRVSFGDPDAVSVGDYNLPALVCGTLAGEPGGDDARMLELLEPYRGQRARVVLLIEASGRRPARRAPRMPARDISRI